MFHIDSNFVLALIAMALGAFLVLVAKVHKEVPTKPCSIVGMVVVVLSAFVLLVSGYGMTKSYFMKRRMMSSMHQSKMRPKMHDMIKKMERSTKDKNGAKRSR